MSQKANDGIAGILSKSISVLSYGDIVSFKKDANKKKYRVICSQIHKDNEVKYTVNMMDNETKMYVASEDELNIIEENRVNIFNNNSILSNGISSVKEAINNQNNMLDEIKHIVDEIETDTMINRRVSSYSFRKYMKDKKTSTDSITPRTNPSVYYVRADSNCFVNDSFVLGGDYYMFVEYPNGAREYLFRDIKLKPFRKRIFNTLLYGRYHMSNYDVIEPMFNFSIRCRNHINNIIDTAFDAVLITGEYALTRVYP